MRGGVLLSPGLHREAGENTEVSSQLANRRGTQGLTPSYTHPVSPARSGLVGWWSIPVTTTGGLYVDVFTAYIPQLVHEALRVYFPAITDASGAGRLRLKMVSSAGTQFTDSQPLLANSNSTYLFEWLHGQDTWTTTDAFVSTQVLVSAINVSVFAPYGGGIVQQEPRNATDTGLV